MGGKGGAGEVSGGAPPGDAAEGWPAAAEHPPTRQSSGLCPRDAPRRRMNIPKGGAERALRERGAPAVAPTRTKEEPSADGSRTKKRRTQLHFGPEILVLAVKCDMLKAHFEHLGSSVQKKPCSLGPRCGRRRPASTLGERAAAAPRMRFIARWQRGRPCPLMRPSPPPSSRSRDVGAGASVQRRLAVEGAQQDGRRHAAATGGRWCRRRMALGRRRRRRPATGMQAAAGSEGVRRHWKFPPPPPPSVPFLLRPPRPCSLTLPSQ